MEIEAKFKAPDGEVLRALAQVPDLAGRPLTEGVTVEVADSYIDTEGWRILKGGYYCRLRTKRGGKVITVKSLDGAAEGVHRREEYEVALDEFTQPAEWPEGTAREKVLALAEGQPLKEMLALRQTRTTRLVGDPEAPVAELSLDEVWVDSAGSGASGGETAYYEVEVEIKEAGGEDDLAALAAALKDGWPLEPETRSKFERAVEQTGLAPASAHETEEEPQAEEAEVAPDDEAESGCEETVAADEEPSPAAPPRKRKPKRARKDSFLGDGLEVLEKPGLTADDSMVEAARKTLLYHLQKMMLHEPGTRDGEDPEELHDMRVATRRMRAALRVFEDHLDMGQYKPYLKVMRDTGRELGAVRDLDVFMIKTQAYIDSLPEEERHGLDPLVAAWRTERERARAELLVYLDDDRYQRFKEKFEAFLRTPGVGAGVKLGRDGGPAPTRVGDVLPGVLFDRLALVKAYDGPISEPDAQLAVFHQLRITSKGLRYTLEFFSEVMGSDSKPLIDRTKQVQDHLGDLQDAVVTCDVLLGFLGSGTWGIQRGDKRTVRALYPVNAPGIATYLAVKQAEIDRLMHTFGPLWERIHGSEFSRPLAQLVATL